MYNKIIILMIGLLRYIQSDGVVLSCLLGFVQMNLTREYGVLFLACCKHYSSSRHFVNHLWSASYLGAPFLVLMSGKCWNKDLTVTPRKKKERKKTCSTGAVDRFFPICWYICDPSHENRPVVSKNINRDSKMCFKYIL